jgi:hypothetical protein
MKMYGVWLPDTMQWYRLPSVDGTDLRLFETPARGVAEAQTRGWQIPFKIAVFGDDGMPLDEID